MGILGDKLALAIKEKKSKKNSVKNDMNTWVWKGPKKDIAGVRCQNTVKMVDATPEQLKEWYNHCISMLFNENKTNPGRYNLKKIVKEQIDNCTTELCIRWIEGRYFIEGDNSERGNLPRNLLYKDLNTLLTNDENKETISRDHWNSIPLNKCMNNLPAEFRDVSVKQTLDGCLDFLGVFNRKHITLTFLLKLGIELTPEEFKEFTSEGKKALEVIRERLKIPTYLKIHRSSKGGLTFKELESLIHLKEAKYSMLSNDKLVLLKNKVLNRFIKEIDYQIISWENIIKKLEYVANTKYNFSLLPDSTKNSYK